MCRFLIQNVSRQWKEWLSLSQYSGIYLGIYCTVFYPKRMKIFENSGKSPFMSSIKALLSPLRLSGNSNCPKVLPGDLLYQISPKSVRKQKVQKSSLVTGPEGSRKLRFPDFATTAQDGGKVVSPTHRPPLPPPGNAPSTHFC